MFKFFIPFSSLVIKLTDVIISTQWRNLQVATIIMLVLVWFEDVFITLLSLHSCCVLVNRWCSSGGGRGDRGGGEVKRFSVGTLLVRLMHSILTLTQKAGLSQCGLTQWSRNEFVMVLITADYFMFSKYITWYDRSLSKI